jgi:EF hand
MERLLNYVRAAGAGVVALGAALSVWGCSSAPSRIEAIDVDPANLSDAVLEAHDTDGSGALSSEELKAIPPVLAAQNEYDTDGNGEVTGEELTARFTQVFDPNMGAVLPVRCRVTRNGAPLAGADVRFVPPKVLEGVLPPATGVSESDGIVAPGLAPEDVPENFPNKRVPVMRPGVYLVEVTHQQLQIPAQYNTQTTLGKEVFSQLLNGPPLAIDLKF